MQSYHQVRRTIACQYYDLPTTTKGLDPLSGWLHEYSIFDHVSFWCSF